MRIAIIRLSATPLVDNSAEGTFGGAEVRALTFAQGLADLTPHDVRLVVQGSGGQVIPRRGRLSIERVAGWRRSGQRPGPGRALWQGPAAAVRRWTRSLQRRLSGEPGLWPDIAALPADVLCSFGLHDPTAAVVQTAGCEGKRKVVFLTSDEDTQRALAAEGARDRHRRWHRYAIEHADLLVAQTERQQDWLRAAGRPVVLIRNPIDTSLPSGRIVPMAERQHVLWVGRADTDSKRADLCLQLAARCPQVPFVVVMNPQDHHTHRRLMAQVPANVRVLPHVAWRDSDDWYRHALALLNTSDSEGFPNAFLQAGKHGVPILSRRVNPDEVLTQHRWGFVAHDDLAELARMTQRIHAEPERFTQVSLAARRYVERYHRLDERCAELETALRRLDQVVHRPQPVAAGCLTRYHPLQARATG
jgi:glycosyltransferase involved in cell wall biosynthesis